ncbi:NUDIX hydrolase [Shouchella clausii]|uniref:NUDIX hydrolase n=1 Tax=Shouchella clausii TaxID=79880 RepID=UPI003D161D5E
MNDPQEPLATCYTSLRPNCCKSPEPSSKYSASSITNALKREVMEESGVEIEIGPFCGISQDVNKAICHTWWLARATTSKLKTSEESIEVKFVTEEDAITMMAREDFKKELKRLLIPQLHPFYLVFYG